MTTIVGTCVGEHKRLPATCRIRERFLVNIEADDLLLEQLVENSFAFHGLAPSLSITGR
jgi:hypothetical protein